MPIYEYDCAECGKTWEVLQKMDAPAPACPNCGEPGRKRVSAASFVLRGQGWGRDNYGLKPEKKASEKKGGQG